MFDWLFKEFPRGVDILGNDTTAVSLHVIGGGLISFAFFAIGMMCLVMPGVTSSASKKRIILTRMFGMFLMSCALARIVEILCLWHNYANINGIMKILTGGIALVALFYIPFVILEALAGSSINEVSKDMTKMKEDIEKVKSISRKLE